MSGDAWSNEPASDITIHRADKVERAGWRYPFNPHPKQALASSYMVDEMLMGGAAGPGKDISISEYVMTRAGWSTQGNLRPGDEVLAPDGTWTTVTAAYPVESNPCYAITFSTGETITAGEGHLWTVLVNGSPVTVDTAQLHAALQHGTVRLPPTAWNPRITALRSTPTATVPTRCVAVNHPSRLYLVGRSLIPTHNTDWMLAELVNLSLAIPNVKTLLLRNKYGDLQEEIIPRLEERIPPWVGKYSSKLRSFVFYNGARLRLGYLEYEKNQQQYIGAEYAAIGFDELTLLPWRSYQFLASRARATGHTATMLARLGLRPRRLATSNPGGPSHSQVKAHFVDPVAPNTIYRDPATGLTRVYVPATVDDNPSMPAQYRQLLESLPSEKRKALLEGSWDILEGARFSSWNAARHVVSSTQLPPDLLAGERVIAVDYGFADPFAALWMVKLGSGLIVIYRELYSTELTPEQQARLILDNTTESEWESGISIVMDPAMWGRRDASAPKTGNPNIPPVSSPAHTYQTVLNRTPLRANNDRLSGWAMLDEKLRVHDDGWPRLVVYDWCRDLIRTLPALERDKKNPDNVSQTPKQEDHLCHPAGTMVTTRRGDVPIETIRPGDEALTRAGYRPVVAWAKTNETGAVGEVPVADGLTLRSTANHPYWVDGRGWTRADHLRPGDVVRHRTSPALAGAPVRVAGNWQPVSVEPVYTMTVEEHHEFWADGFLVSNSDALRYGAMHLSGRTVSNRDEEPVFGSETMTRGIMTRKW